MNERYGNVQEADASYIVIDQDVLKLVRKYLRLLNGLMFQTIYKKALR